MPKTSKQLFNVLIALMLLSSTVTFMCQAEPTEKDIIELEEGKAINVTINKMRELRYFKYVYSDTDNSHPDLSIIADPLDTRSDPDIYASKTHKFPDGENNEYSDVSYGFDLVVIPYREVKPQGGEPNRTVYIGVQCQSKNCNFQLKAMKITCVTATIDQAVKLTFLDEATQNVRFTIPDDKSIQRIVIQAQIMNAETLTKPIHFYVNKGETTPSSTRHDVDGTAAWFDGKAAILNQGDRYFCTGCSYTLAVEAEKGAILRVETMAYASTIELALGAKREDAVSMGNTVTYVVDLSSITDFSRETLDIRTETYAGVIALYVNPNELPQKLTDYKWQEFTHGREMLLLKPEDLKAANIKQLFITVEGVTTSTYKITVMGHESYTATMRLGVTESGYVRKDQIANFYLMPWGRDEAYITLTLSSVVGNPDLYMKSCKSKDDCAITRAEIEDYQKGYKLESTSYPMWLVSKNEVGDDTIVFYHSNKDCPREGGSSFWLFRPCLYCIAVINGGETEVAQFNLIGNAPKTPVRLEENTPFRGRIELGQINHYYFTVLDDSKVESVDFQVTPISGTVTTYASTTTRFPDVESHEKASYINDKISFKKKDIKDGKLATTFYVGVKAITHASYTVLATVNYTSGTAKNGSTINFFSVTELFEGIPQKVIIAPHEVKFFKFELNLDMENTDEKEPGVRINLQPLQGSFNFYVSNNGTLATNTAHQFSTTQNNLKITNASKAFKPVGTYYIAVYPDTSGSGPRADKLSFVLTYVRTSKFTWLRTGEGFSDYINKKTKLFFRFEVDAMADGVEITKSMDDRKVDLYVSTDRKNIFPSKVSYNFTTTSLESDYIYIPKEHIQKACAHKHATGGAKSYDENHKCIFYISASTNEETDVYFYLFIQVNQSVVQLREGMSLELPFPENTTEPVKLYYIPDVIDNIEFVASSPYRKLAVYANVININDFKSEYDWKFPTSQESEYKSVADLSSYKTSMIKVDATRLSRCTDNGIINCAVTLSIFKLDKGSTFDSEGNSTLPSWIAETFAIIATTGVYPLPIGRPFVGNVQEGAYKYYSFRVTQPDCIIMISVTPLSKGDPDIVVARGEDARPTFASPTSYDFSSSNFAGEQLEISNSDLTDSNATMEGTWVVGVFGYKACSFQIIVTYEKTRIIELFSSIPQDIAIKAGETVYFKYLNWQDSFDINLMAEVGQGLIRANTFNSSQDIHDRLPTREDAMFTSYKENARERISINNKTRNYCTDCFYLIGVTASDWGNDFRGTLLITAPDEMIYLQNGKSLYYYVGAKEKTTFAYVDLTGANVSTVGLSMVVYSGHPIVYVDHIPAPDASRNGWKLDCDYYSEGYGAGLSTFSLIMDDAQYWESVAANPAAGSAEINGTTYQAERDMFYITIEGKTSSNFSIVVLRSDTQITLRDGVPEAAFTLPRQESTFIYNSPIDPVNSNQRLKVLINVYESGFSATQRSNDQFEPEVSVVTTNRRKGTDEERREETLYRRSISTGMLSSRLRSQLAFSVNQYKAQYNIIVRNPHDHILNYTITIQDKHFIKLPLNTFQMSRIDVGSSEIYEVHIQGRGHVTIDTYTCFGRVDVDIAKSLADAQEGRFHENLAVFPGYITKSLIVTEPTPLYIRVKGSDGYIDDDNDPVREALYKIKVTMAGFQEPMLQEVFGLNTSQIIATQTGPQQVNFKWDHVIVDAEKAGTLFDRYQITVNYKLVFSDDPIFAESKALCDVEPHNRGEFTERVNVREFVSATTVLSKNVKYTDKMERTVTLTQEELAGISYVAVLARVEGFHGNGSSWVIPFKYDTIEFHFEKVRKSSGLWFFILACLVGIAAIGTGVWWYNKRFRSIEGLLHYELPDASSLGSTREKYSGLMNQNVDTAM